LTGAKEEYNIYERQIENCTGEENSWKIHIQFREYIKSVIQMEQKSSEDLGDALLEALCITVPQFTKQNFWQYRYGRQELAILVLMAENQCCHGNLEGGILFYQDILTYMEKYIRDKEERNVLYPETVAALAEKLVKVGRYGGLSNCQKALELLRENHRMNGMENLLSFCLIECEQKEELLSGREQTIYREAVQVLRGLQLELVGNKRESIYPLLKVVSRGQVLGERIRRARKSQRLSVERLSERIDCSPKALEKIERGETSPTGKHYRAVMKELGMEECRIYPFIYSDSYEMHETVKRLEKWLTRLDYVRAEEELVKLERGLSEDICNRQLLQKNRAIINAQAGRISRKEERELLWDAFHMTAPTEVEYISFWPLNQMETQILNLIALSLNEEGKRGEAIELLKMAKKRYEVAGKDLGKLRKDVNSKTFAVIRSVYREVGMSLEYNATPYLLITSNLINFIGSEGRYEEALQLIDEIMPLAYKLQRINVVARLLYERAWNMEQMMEKKQVDTMLIRDRCLPFFYQRYLLSMVSGQQVRAKVVVDYCREKYGIDWEC